MIGVTDVFVSYKAEDLSRLLPFVEALEAEEFQRLVGHAHWRQSHF